MRTIALSAAKDNLSGLVEDATRTHELTTITRHGRPAAVLMSADEFESLMETLDLLSTPGAVDELHQSARDYAQGRHIDAEDLRAEFGLT